MTVSHRNKIVARSSTLYLDFEAERRKKYLQQWLYYILDDCLNCVFIMNTLPRGLSGGPKGNDFGPKNVWLRNKNGT